MYHALLTNRYLTSRVIPLIAIGAVALCVALVIVVVSVMSGFLDMVKSSGRTLMGDVVVHSPVSGIPHYQRLIRRLESLPEAVAATPVVDSWGLLRMPYPDGPEKQIEYVQIWGVEPEGFARVTGYERTVHWRQLSEAQWNRLYADLLQRQWRDALDRMDERQRIEFVISVLSYDPPDDFAPPSMEKVRELLPNTTDAQWESLFLESAAKPELLKARLGEAGWKDFLALDNRLLNDEQILQDGLLLQRNGHEAIALGMHVSEGNERQRDGSYRPRNGGYWWMPAFDVTLTAVPISGGGLADPESVILPIANEFVSGVFLIDDKRVMVPLAVAQRMLHMDRAERVDEDDPSVVLGEEPARATMVLVRARDGFTPAQLRTAVQTAYDDFRNEILADPDAIVLPPAYGFGLAARTWEEQQAQFIGPVEKERELMRTLFSIVYVVCGALILSIFWAFVFEKTRDIGILRSVGAGRTGIMWVFLRYGFWIGLIGGAAGVGLGWLIVRNINPIHTAVGSPPVLLAVLAATPCALALVWIVYMGGWRGLSLLLVTLTALTVVEGVVALAIHLAGVDGLAFAGQWREILLGSALLLMLFCAIAMGESMPRLALIPAMVGTLLFVVSAALAAGIYAAHLYGGVVMWDPSVYYFSVIPNQVDWRSAWGTMFLALTFSLLGAAIPAAKAADTDPVKALRYE